MILFDEQPIVIPKETAKALGLNKAIILQQVQFWTKIAEKKKINFKDGHYWMYRTLSEWVDEFPWWNEKTIQRALSELEQMGFLISSNFNSNRFNKTKWFRIDLDKMSSSNIYKMSRSEQDKMSRSYTENTETTETENSTDSPSSEDSSGEESSFQLESEDPDPGMQKPIKSKKGHKQDLEGRFKPLLESFKSLHKEFRNRDPIVNYPQEMKALKALFIRFGTEEEILRQAKAFIYYLKDGKGSQYGKTSPILPSQLTQPVLNRIQPYLDKETNFVPTETKEIIYNKKTSFEEIL